MESNRLLKILPNQVFAVGDNFRRLPDDERTRLYSYDAQSQTIFGIPIKDPQTNIVFPDEVRVYPNDILTAAVTVDTWLGVVATRYCLSQIGQYLTKVPQIPENIPVFSVGFDLINTSLKEVLEQSKRRTTRIFAPKYPKIPYATALVEDKSSTPPII
ncbi:hypothetical protein HY025_05790 [Candidatus Daviesbacteria bacterium]|nr:hypothetical protein [Candidatus Daviesbacteria bacterium]